tara:strand:+ start:10160 stop:11734 length:1575 start_codon:yes stop_codon:yes gene_type:complete
MSTVRLNDDLPTATDTPIAFPAEIVDRQDFGLRRRWFSMQGIPAWLISTLLHVVILLLLGAVTFSDPIRIVNVMSAALTAEDGPEVEEFVIEELDPGDAEESEEMSEPVDIAESIQTDEVAEIEMPLAMSAVEMAVSEVEAVMAQPIPKLQTLAALPGAAVSSRGGDKKQELLRKYGGNASSEAAVTEALKWISRHQLPNGAWTFQHNLVCRNACGDPGESLVHRRSLNAATSLALLPFLGAGQTHREGEFKEVVFRGLSFLARNGIHGNVKGVAAIDYQGEGNMYAHGLTAITLCEAYAMTQDPELAEPAQGAINFIYLAQCDDGGWRYRPKDFRGGDTSVFGWQLMALKSGHMGHLVVPPSTIQNATKFLNRVQTQGGSHYKYDIDNKTDKISTTAIGLLCRMYTGWDKNTPAMVQGVEAIAENGIDKRDIYYNYYAAQVLRQFGGPSWDEYNVSLRDWLVSTQVTSGGGKGSWHFPDSKFHRGPIEGGRLASTSFATMILEVYYRHMPLYADKVVEDEFPL